MMEIEELKHYDEVTGPCKHDNSMEVRIKTDEKLIAPVPHFIKFCTDCKMVQYPAYTRKGSILPAPQWMTINEYRITLAPRVILETLSGIEIPT